MGKATANLPHRYKTICPVCGKVSAFATAEAVTEINCGDCLMDRLKIVRLEATDCDGLMVPDLTNVVLFRRPI
jgi:hypothetical protein